MTIDEIRSDGAQLVECIGGNGERIFVATKYIDAVHHRLGEVWLHVHGDPTLLFYKFVRSSTWSEALPK